MQVDPALELQAALVAVLTGATDAGSNVYDRVPPPAPGPFPRITLGPAQETSDRGDCRDATISNLQVDVWSRAVGFPEAKIIAGQVRKALLDADLSLPCHVLELIEFESAVFLDDPDGLTRHVAILYRVQTHPID